MKQQIQTNQIEWREVELGNEDFFNILSSGINKFSDEKDYLSTESVQDTRIEKIECKITCRERPSRANMQPVFNSVWFAKMKSTIKVYSFSKNNEEEIVRYILSTGFAGIKLDKNISPDYVKFFFLTERFNEEKDKLSTGSTQSGINNSFISKIKIPLPFRNGQPDLEEQQRIVSILEEAERVKERSKKAGALLDGYLKSMFYDMFGNAKTNSKNWKTLETQNLFDMKLGKMLSAKNYTGKNLRPYLRNINVKWGYLDLEDVKEMDFDAKEFELYKLKIGDILVCEGGEVGRTAIYNGEIENCCYQNALHRLRIKDDKIINRNYFLFFMMLAVKEGLIKTETIQVTIAHFTAEKFRRLKIPLPPIELQQQFASIVEHVEKMKEKVKITRTNSEELFNSLMQKAFRGEL